MQVLILPTAKTITLPGDGNHTREVWLDGDKRLKLRILKHSADSMEVARKASILPGLHTARLVGGKNVPPTDYTLYVAAPDTQPADPEQSPNDARRDNKTVDNNFKRGDDAFTEYHTNYNNKDWYRAKVSLMKAASAYKSILIARHSAADAVKVHYNWRWTLSRCHIWTRFWPA